MLINTVFIVFSRFLMRLFGRAKKEMITVTEI